MTSKTSLSDQELWQNIRAGDHRSFTLFYDRYWLRMYKAALYYLKDKDASEEIVQEVFVLIWNKRETLGINNFSSYLNSATRYEVFRKLKLAKRSLVEYLEDYPTPETAVYNFGYEKLNEMDHNHFLENCLKDLPKRCREVFYLSKIEQLSNTEIAEKLGINKHTVENQLTIALRHVKVNFSKVAILGMLLIKVL